MQRLFQELLTETQKTVSAHPSSHSWFCLDGKGFASGTKTYIGIATRTLTCSPDSEKEFRESITRRWKKTQETKSSAKIPGLIFLLGYKFAHDKFTHETSANQSTNTTGVALEVPAVIEIDWERANVSIKQTLTGETDVHSIALLHDVLKNAQENVSRNICLHKKQLELNQSQKNLDIVFQLRSARDNYLEAIAKSQCQISSGTVDVLCLTNKILVKTKSHVDPVASFLALIELSGTAYNGLIVWEDNWFMSASPESLFKLFDDKVTVSPIKGTRKRQTDQEKDIEEALGLLHNKKEKTENNRVLNEVKLELMKLSGGEVTIVSNGHIESNKRVHHLVSTATVEVDAGIDMWKIIDRVCPAASMTGVPKKRAMNLLAELEEGERGWYSGCFGFTSADGKTIKMATAIRSIECESRNVSIGSGGGITEASDSEKEWEEMLYKAEPMVKAIQVLGEKPVS